MTLDLSTEQGRRRARYELTWGDHGFLRVWFQNLHQISDEMWRANQPSPEQIREHARERGIKTIINLRGESPKGYYLLEKEACEANGIDLVDFQMFSRDTPTPEKVHGARDLFETIKYPALMHCKSGADRAGIMAVLYMHFRQGLPIRDAVEQLSFKYLHVKEGKTGMLDHFFQTYLKVEEDTGMSFMDWIDGPYDRLTVKEEFLRTWKAKLMVDRILRRE
ncbi:MAG: protein tyrosine phosphatase [Hirschia sp.]|nr:protein tyrosine phosphatase [Hirschia sp.]MBF18472.1 protein tyrosine phosphatase [Hirschia sp.]|tara:strand:+ start:793 stop:1455 length:663 start_codon:yes stop_codon:yes gene_type:complete